MVVEENERDRKMKMTEGRDQKLQANISLLGAEHVGKSALTVRFLTRRFIGEYGDIESIYSHCEKINGQEVCCNIWDSLCPQVSGGSGQVSAQQLDWSDGFLLVYSICDRDSFLQVQKQLRQIRQVRQVGARQVPVVLVGNKLDLRHRRVVSSEEGRQLARSAHCRFFEISAAETYHEVLLVFHQLLQLIQETRTPRKGTGFRGIVRSVSAAFQRKPTEPKLRT